jgi:hypothetical protein
MVCGAEQGIMEFVVLKMDITQFVVLQTDTWDSCLDASNTFSVNE